MKRLVLVILVSWSGLVYFSASTRAASRETLRNVPQPGATLYQAAFKTKKLKGWIAPGEVRSDWSINRNGVVSSPKAASSELLAPFRLGGIRDFAVQAKIKVTGKASNSGPGYGLVVRTAGDGSGGVLGGIVYSVRLGDTVPQLVWGYDTVGGAKPAFPAGYSVYRLVVHKTDYTLFINGQQVVQFKLADARTGQRVGLWTVNQAIQVTSFTVSRLQAAAPLPALPPVKTINLGPSDVPSPLLPQEGHYFSAEELSRVDNLPVSTLESRGFAAAYGVSYATQTLPDSGPEFIDSVVNAATSPVAAQQQMARDLAHDQAFAGKLSNYTTGDLSGLGDQAHQLRYDWSTASAQFTRIDLYLTRGSYDIEIGEDFIRGTVSQADMVSQTLALAKIMDQRAQQAG